MKNFIFTAIVAGAVVFSGCSAIQSSLSAVSNATDSLGLTEEAETRSVSMEGLFPALSTTQASSLDPFAEEPVEYQVIGIAEVDGFTEASANLYANLLVLDNVVTNSQNMVSNPSLTVGGFNDARSLLSVGQTIVGSVTTDLPALLQSGQSLIGNVANIAASNPMAIPRATQELQTGLERLNESQQLLRDLSGQLTSLATSAL